MLTKLRKDHSRRCPPAKDTKPVTFGGAITELTDASISLHDGDRDLTVLTRPGLPADRRITRSVSTPRSLRGRVLTAIAPVTAGDAGRYFVGTIATLADGSITLTTEHGPATCTITALSPSTDSFKVGDKVGMGCRATTMELVLLRAARR